MHFPRTLSGCLSVLLTEYMLLLVKTEAQSLEVRTGKCSRFIGGQIEIIGKYTSTPALPVQWQRPDLTGIGACQPGGCTSNQLGYELHQSNSGLDYTLLIANASAADEGLWELIDGITTLPTSLTFTVNLTAVNVNCAASNTSRGYTGSVTCTTDCVDDAMNILYNVNNLPPPQTNSNSTGCPSGARYSSTIPLDSNLHSGISELCYILSSGNCNHTQTDDCTSVVIEALTETTSTTELTTLTSFTTDVTFTDSAKSTASLTSDTPVSDNVVIGEPTTTTIPPTPTTTETSTPCSAVTSKTPPISTSHVPSTTCPPLPVPECYLIAVLVLAGLLGLGGITFLGILIKRGPEGSCWKGVIAILGTTALVAVVVIILVVLDLNDICFEILFLQRNSQISNCTAELESATGISGLGISGSVLFALDGVAFIVAVVIYCKEGKNTEKPGNDVHMKPRNGAP